MKDVRITVKKKAHYEDLIADYENPIINPCPIRLGEVFISKNATKPEGLCDSAWVTLSPFVNGLASGEEDYYSGWMKNKKSVMISCNDGFRPVSFYVEVIEDE